MEDRRDLIQWIKEHKKQLIFAGIGVGTLILIVLGLKNQEEIKSVWKSLEEVAKRPAAKAVKETAKVMVEATPERVPDIPSAVVTVTAQETIPFEVSRHIRNLPDGWHASPEKVAEALKNNIILGEGQTWVDSYMKGCTAA